MCNQDMEILCNEIPRGDIELLVCRYYKPGVKTLDKLHDIAMRPKLGHLGLIEDIMSNAWAESKVKKKSVTDKLVMSIARDVMENISQRRDLYAD